MDGPGNALDVEWIDQKGAVLKLIGCAGEFTQYENAVAFDITDTVLFGDQIHPVFNRRNQRDFCSAVVSDQLDPREAPELVVDGDPSRACELPIDLTHQPLDLLLELDILGYLATTRDDDLDEADPLVQFGVGLKRPAKCVQAVGYALSPDYA